MSYFGVSLRNGVGLGLGTVPSLTNTPLSYRLAPSLDLSFAGSDSLSPAITFSRTSNATLTNSAGLVAYAPTNLLTFSEQFDNAVWVKSGAAVTANTTVAPDGTTTADSVTFSITPDYVYNANVATYAAGAAYTWSLYVKSALRAITWGGATAAGTDVYTSTSVGNGWYRQVLTRTFTAAGTSATIQALLSGSQPIGTGTFAVWGAQLELGSTATTYNPTTVKNLLGYTENFDNAAWTKGNSFVQTNLLTYSEFPNGLADAPTNSGVTATTLTGYAGAIAFGSGVDAYAYKSFTTTIGVAYTISVIVQMTDGLAPTFSANATDATNTFAFVIQGDSMGPPSGYTVTSLGNNLYRVSTSLTATKAASNTGVVKYATNNSRTFKVTGYQLVQGTSAGDYKTTYAAAAPVGYTDIYGQPFAQKLVEDTVNTWHGVRQSASTGLVGVFSFYAKAAERSRVWVAFDTPDFVAAVATFNLAAGTVQSGTGTITDIGSGWYRCSVSGTVSARGVTIAVANDAGTVIRTGDGTSGIYIFGAQLSDSASVDPYVYQPVAAPTSTAYYGPRFDYDPVTLQPKGLLIEEQRTNLVLNSSILNTQIVTVTAAAHTLSFYGTGTIVLSGAYTGTLVGTGAYPTRTTLTFTPIIGALTLTVTGSVTMAQLEAGAFATSYIPTVASQVTRAADNASMIGNNFARWYTQGVGTLFASGDFYSTASVTYSMVALNAGTSAESISLVNYGGTPRLLVISSSTVQAEITSGSTTAGALNKLIGAYAVNDFAYSRNGSAAATDTSGVVPVVNTMSIGAQVGTTNPLNGHISRIAYYNRRLSNTELQGITA